MTDKPRSLEKAYALEKKLAGRLRSAARAERKGLYQEVYDLYYRQFPHHPFIEQDENLHETISTRKQLSLLRPFLNPKLDFAEIGTGTGVVAFAVSNEVNSVKLIDISRAPTENVKYPANAELLISNGVNLPSGAMELDLIYSHQLMEHLHPEDAEEQLADIWNALRPGGKYICVTPHRYSGPHDISKHYDEIATCFHLKEYTVFELSRLFRKVGFKSVRYHVLPKGRLIRLPHLLIYAVEFLLFPVPQKFRRWFARRLPVRALLNFALVATK